MRKIQWLVVLAILNSNLLLYSISPHFFIFSREAKLHKLSLSRQFPFWIEDNWLPLLFCGFWGFCDEEPAVGRAGNAWQWANSLRSDAHFLFMSAFCVLLSMNDCLPKFFLHFEKPNQGFLGTGRDIAFSPSDFKNSFKSFFLPDTLLTWEYGIVCLGQESDIMYANDISF